MAFHRAWGLSCAHLPTTASPPPVPHWLSCWASFHLEAPTSHLSMAVFLPPVHLFGTQPWLHLSTLWGGFSWWLQFPWPLGPQLLTILRFWATSLYGLCGLFMTTEFYLCAPSYQNIPLMRAEFYLILQPLIPST